MSLDPSDFYDIKNGLNPGNIKHILISNQAKTLKHKPIIWGKDISRYTIQWSGDYINYDENIAATLTIDDVKSKEGMNKQNKIDFALRDPSLFNVQKIVIRKTGDRLIAALDNSSYYFDTLVHGIYIKDSDYTLPYILAVLNSKIATALYRLYYDIKGKVFAKISVNNLLNFPIPQCSLRDQNKIAEVLKRLVEFQGKFLQLNDAFLRLLITETRISKITAKTEKWYEQNFTDFLKELDKAKISLSLAQKSEWMQHFEAEKAKALALKAEIDRLDAEIDQMVYALYGLTPDEIAIVEGT